MLADAARKRQGARGPWGSSAAPVGRMLDGMFLMKGIATLGASLIIAVLGPFAMQWSAEMAAKANAAIPAVAVPFANRPWLLSVVALPSIACGVMLLVTKRYRWAALTISTLIMLFVLLIVLVVFTAGLGTLYGDAMKPL